MQIDHLSNQMSVSAQISFEDTQTLADLGVQVVICNRPDNEEPNQILFEDIAAASQALGMEAVYIAFTSGNMSEQDRQRFAEILASGQRIHAYCRTGNRSKQLWQAALAVLKIKQQETENAGTHLHDGSKYDVVIIGAGSGGIATASSLLKRNKKLRIALIDPSKNHYYQPGWSLVGGGVLDVKSTRRDSADVIPPNCDWIKHKVVLIESEHNKVILDNNASVFYCQLVVAPGLKLNWAAIEGLVETLGKNSVTSNYRYDLAPYTWELVSKMKQGKAIFTQPPMPIKCAGAPQKAMYLSASEWSRSGKLNNISIQFYNSGAVLFGVEAYVPALMKYIKKYKADLCFKKTLVKIDGANKKAWFKDGDGQLSETSFDFIHVCPPQAAPDFIKESGLADDAGWLDVDSASLQSKKASNIWGVGDVMNTANAKTMAAARKQAPVVAQNIVNAISKDKTQVYYDGYGSCPLMVEHGKVVLAEFIYGGKLAPSFPGWLNDGTKATFLGWFLKSTLLPIIYWHAMLKGREWLAKPRTSR